MNKKYILLIIALAALAAFVFYKIQLAPKPQTNNITSIADSQRFAADYTMVKNDNRFILVTGDQAINTLKNGSGVLFLGFKECPWCQNLAPLVDEAAKLENLQQIQYLDIKEARSQNNEAYKELVTILKDHLEKDENGEPRVYVPDVTAVKNGIVTARFEMENTDGSTTPEQYWTQERKARALTQLREMIKSTR